MSNKVLDIATQVMVMAVVISVILLFVGIGVLILIHVCIVGRAFRRGFITSGNGDERGDDGDDHQNGRRRRSSNNNSMSYDDLEKLPSFDFQSILEKGMGNYSPVDCCICLENFNNGDKCRLLPLCKHSFHAKCVDSWLMKTPICPICRTSADFDGSSYNSGEVIGVELMTRRSTQVSSDAEVGNHVSLDSSSLANNSQSEHNPHPSA